MSGNYKFPVEKVGVHNNGNHKNDIYNNDLGLLQKNLPWPTHSNLRVLQNYRRRNL